MRHYFKCLNTKFGRAYNPFNSLQLFAIVLGSDLRTYSGEEELSYQGLKEVGSENRKLFRSIERKIEDVQC